MAPRDKIPFPPEQEKKIEERQDAIETPIGYKRDLPSTKFTKTASVAFTYGVRVSQACI